MRKLLLSSLIVFLLVFNYLKLPLHADTKKKIVYLVPIKGVIDLGLSPFIERIIKEAEPIAEAIVFDISTFGGRVDAAIQIKDAILNTHLLTIAYVNKRAISAGALIALSTKKIVMSPGSTIGAVEPKPTDEKSVSFLMAEMVSTAQQTGRPADLAEAMVDKDIEIEGLIKKGKLLTLSCQEALKRKFVEDKASNINEVLRLYKLDKAKIIKVSLTWSERIVRFLTHPIVSSLLLSLGFIALISEFHTPMWGIAGTMGIICMALFFGSHFIAGLADWINILLFIAGLTLIIAEVFFIPGFGIAGGLGVICMALSLILSFKDLESATLTLSLTFIIVVISTALLFKYLPKTCSWQRLVLRSQELKEEGFLSSKGFDEYINKEGYALTPLRPSGSCLVEGQKLDVITEGDFLSANTRIKVVRVEGSKIVVNKAVG
ncbi:MAG: NfeD family protein [bacterium]|nr:NfeD family protein [bacterium]